MVKVRFSSEASICITAPRCLAVIASTRSDSLRIFGVSSRAAKSSGVPPYVLMMSAEGGWIGSPTMARVPALRTTKAPGCTWSRPACSRRSATGERQMLPVQTVRIRTGWGVSKVFPTSSSETRAGGVVFESSRAGPTGPLRRR